MKSIFILFLLLYIHPAIASDALRILTWEDCVKLASEKNQELQSAHESFKQVQFLEDAAQSSFFPKISASISGNKSYLQNNNTESYSTQLNLSQNIFSGFNSSSKYYQSQQNTLSAKANFQIVKSKISANLKKAYANLVYAKDYLDLMEKIYSRRENNLKNVELRYNGGRENKGSVLLSEAYFQQATYDKFSAEQQLESSTNELLLLLGIDKNEKIKIQGQIPVNNISKDISIDFDSLVHQAPEFTLAKAQESSAQWDVDLAKSAFYPLLDFSASLGKIDDHYPIAFEKSSTNKWSAGLTLTIPLWDGWHDTATTNAAEAKKNSFKAQRQNLETSLYFKLKQTYNNLLLVIEKDKVDKKFKLAASTREEIARSKYNNGLLSFDAWDQVESDLILREKTALSSERDRTMAEADWEQAIGLGELP
jgi:outer membrane protein TolC